MRASAVALTAALALTACGGGKDHVATPAKQSLRPTFAPTSTTQPGGATTTGSSSTTTTHSGQHTTTPTAAPSSQTSASITDHALDTSPSPFDRPPAWADLLGARLIRRADGFELRVRLGGGDAPESSGSDDHTMNVASFYDVNGDGTIDYEVWANLASGGWGESYFDNSKKGGVYQEASGVAVTTEGDEVILRFPLAHLANAERFRWSLASEWGRYNIIGTDQMARDQAPDDSGAADFPAP